MLGLDFHSITHSSVITPALKVSFELKNNTFPFRPYISYSPYRLQKDQDISLFGLKPTNSTMINSDLRLGIRKYFQLIPFLPVHNIYFGTGAIFINATNKRRDSLFNSSVTFQKTTNTQGFYVELGSQVKLLHFLRLGYNLGYSFVDLNFNQENNVTKINPSELYLGLQVGFAW